MPLDPAPELLRPERAARMLGVTPLTLIRWEQKGYIFPVRTPGGQRRYYRADVLRLIDGTV